MPYAINHLHLKVPDPDAAADWWAGAFHFTVVAKTTRDFGDRFVICESENGIRVMLSNERSGETLGAADAGAHFGLEHFGFDSADLEADIARLEGLGAQLAEGPLDAGPGVRIAFLQTPDRVRVELIERS